MKNDIYRERPFMVFLSRLFDILVLNFLCLLLCIPVITAADAISSMYYVMMRMIRDEDTGTFHDFFHFFAGNFLKSLPFAIILTAVNGMLYFWLIGMAFSSRTSPAGFGAVIALTSLSIILFAWVLLLFARFDNTVGNTFGNAVCLATANPARSLALLAVNGLMTGWFLISPDTFVYILAIWLFLGIGTAGYVSARLALPVFEALMPEKETIPDPLEEEKDDEGTGKGEEGL